MEEKKAVKIRLETFILIAILVILIVVGIIYFINKYKNINNKMPETNTTKTQAKQEIEEQEKEIEDDYKNLYIYKHLEQGLKIETLLPETEIFFMTGLSQTEHNTYTVTGDVHKLIKVNYNYNHLEKEKEYIFNEDGELDLDRFTEIMPNITIDNVEYKYGIDMDIPTGDFWLYLSPINNNEEKFYIYADGEYAISNKSERIIEFEINKNVKFVSIINGKEYIIDTIENQYGSSMNCVMVNGVVEEIYSFYDNWLPISEITGYTEQ